MFVTIVSLWTIIITKKEEKSWNWQNLGHDCSHLVLCVGETQASQIV